MLQLRFINDENGLIKLNEKIDRLDKKIDAIGNESY